MTSAGRRNSIVAAAISFLLALGLVLAGCTAQSTATDVDEKVTNLGDIHPRATDPTAVDTGVIEP